MQHGKKMNSFIGKQKINSNSPFIYEEDDAYEQ
jgi:hypothetical protein